MALVSVHFDIEQPQSRGGSAMLCLPPHISTPDAPPWSGLDLCTSLPPACPKPLLGQAWIFAHPFKGLAPMTLTSYLDTERVRLLSILLTVYLQLSVALSVSQSDATSCCPPMGL